MVYDEGLAQRIREHVGERDFEEKKMFGGIAFLVNGNMFAGVSKDRFMARVSADTHDAALARPGAGIMEMGGRSMKGFIFVAPSGVEEDSALGGWLDETYAYAASLPPKVARAGGTAAVGGNANAAGAAKARSTASKGAGDGGSKRALPKGAKAKGANAKGAGALRGVPPKVASKVRAAARAKSR